MLEIYTLQNARHFFTIIAVFVFSTVVLSVIYLLWQRQSMPSAAPKSASGQFPLLGAVNFFTKRWDFHHGAQKDSETGNFSYWLGQHAIIGLSGSIGRHAFFENKQLGFAEGYSVLFGGGPSINENLKGDADAGGPDKSFSAYFNKTLVHMVKRENFAKNLSTLISDVQDRLDELAAGPSGTTDPFESVFRIVFQLTMRTVGCDDIAENRTLLDKTLNYFEMVEGSSGNVTVMFPWLPSPALLQRNYAGTRLYMIFKSIVDSRQQTGKRREDPLQYLIDQGSDMYHIIQFVIGALFAGQLNSGINAAYVLAWLALDSDSMSKAREELELVSLRYCNESVPLVERLTQLPLEAWETDFKFMDLCLKDSIRLNSLGTAFRRNLGPDIKLATGEVIPTGAFLTYHLGDVHHDTIIYPDSDKWDPSRYTPERAEDKKAELGWLGWGVGRHPCLGMKFAKLEMNIIAAFFLARFDYVVCDANGRRLDSIESPSRNGNSAQKPKQKILFKLWPREM